MLTSYFYLSILLRNLTLAPIMLTCRSLWQWESATADSSPTRLAPWISKCSSDLHTPLEEGRGEGSDIIVNAFYLPTLIPFFSCYLTERDNADVTHVGANEVNASQPSAPRQIKTKTLKCIL